jgi:hypothetical protein
MKLWQTGGSGTVKQHEPARRVQVEYNVLPGPQGDVDASSGVSIR